MRIGRRVIYLFCFLVLAGVSAAAVNRIGAPSILSILLRAVIVAGVAGAPGLVHRRAWPAALVLLPIGAYLICRMAVPLPLSVHGVGAQYHFYVGHVRQGAADYAQKVFPLDFKGAADLKLFLSLIVYAATAVAAFVGLSLRRALPAVVVLLVLLGFALTVDDVRRVVGLPLVFLVLAGCLLMLSRSLKRERWRLRDGVAGGAMAAAAALIALLLLGASPVSAARPWHDWRAWDPFRQVQGTFVFNWIQNYPQLLDPGQDKTIMRVDSSRPSYWRANALDTFNGSAWLSGRSYGQEISAEAANGSFTYVVPSGGSQPQGTEVVEKFHIESTYTNYFFVGGFPKDVVFGKRVSLRTNGMQALRVNQALGPQLDYRVTAVLAQLKPADLVGKGTSYPRDASRYLSLPFPRLAELGTTDPAGRWANQMSGSPSDRQWLPLFALSKQVVGNAQDPYDVTLRIEQYLRGNSFAYSLSPPGTDYLSPYAAFLFSTRTGYCQHFAGAMALLLRYNGIPARVAVGFTSGDKQGDTTYVVSTNNAHAWVEVYFPSAGWVAFDPTPSRNLPGAGPSSSTAGFVNPFDRSDSSSNATQNESTRRTIPADTGSVKSRTASNSSSSSFFTLPRFSWIFVVIAAIAAWPAFRSYIRKRAVRQGDAGRRLRRSIQVLQLSLEDYGIMLGPAATVEDLLLFAGSRLDVQSGVLGARAEAALYGGREPSLQDLDQWATLLAAVGRQLRRKLGWRRTLLAWYGLSRRRFAARPREGCAGA
jgi:transglutaminase-like putative cysteine protease